MHTHMPNYNHNSIRNNTLNNIHNNIKFRQVAAWIGAPLLSDHLYHLLHFQR